MGGKTATKGQKQIDLENSESIRFYTIISFSAIAVSLIPFALNISAHNGYVLPLFGQVVIISRIYSLTIFSEHVFK